MSTETLSRRAGIRLDSTKLDFELARRGLTAKQLAVASGVHETVLSQARHGRALSQRNLRRIAAGLLAIPVIEGVDLLIEP